MLYASDPNGLAAQQFQYDQLYGNANEQAAARFQQAQQQAIQNALQQQNQDNNLQEQDISRQSGLDTLGETQDFQANQNDLDRASRSADVVANKTVNSDAQQERILNEASGVAAWLPTDPVALARLYPMLTPDRIQRLSVIAGAATKQASLVQTAKDAPQVAAATQGQTIADAANRYQRILADQNAIKASPTDAATSWYNPMGWGQPAGIPADNIVQPSNFATARLAALSKSLQPAIAAAGTKDSLIQTDPVTGQLVPAYQMPATATNRVPTIVSSNPVAQPNVTATGGDPAVLRVQALNAIKMGKDPAAVAKRFKDLTGQDL